jgi:hypothetical protein
MQLAGSGSEELQYMCGETVALVTGSRVKPSKSVQVYRAQGAGGGPHTHGLLRARGKMERGQWMAWDASSGATTSTLKLAKLDLSRKYWIIKIIIIIRRARNIIEIRSLNPKRELRRRIERPFT